MRLRYLLVTLATFVLVIGAIFGTLFGLVRYEPDWYANSVPPAGPERTHHSREFQREFVAMIDSVGIDPEWGAEFTEEQINSYFEEGFKQSGLAARLLPEDIQNPRVRVEKDRFHLAFRYGRGTWSTVVSIEMGVWIAPSEPNALALELVGFQVGALPISVQSLLEKVSDIGKQNGIKVEWYRHKETAHPVAILRFQADKPRPTMQLKAVRFEKGLISVRGTTNDLAQLDALKQKTLAWLYPSAD